MSNVQVMRFIARRWMQTSRRLAAILAGTLCDLSIPWAAGALVDLVSRGGAYARSTEIADA